MMDFFHGKMLENCDLTSVLVNLTSVVLPNFVGGVHKKHSLLDLIRTFGVDLHEKRGCHLIVQENIG